METINGSGVDYPTLELGGKVYTVKFTRGGLMYRVSKNGGSLAELIGNTSFAAIFDILTAALHGQYTGTAEQLADIAIEEDKLSEIREVLDKAIKKAFPPTQTVAAGTVGETAPQQVN